MDELDRAQVKFYPDGRIFIEYRSIQFWLSSDSAVVKAEIKRLIQDKYEQRYHQKMCQRLATPPPSQEYEDMASDIFNMIRDEPNFPVWQVMFI